MARVGKLQQEGNTIYYFFQIYSCGVSFFFEWMRIREELKWHFYSTDLDSIKLWCSYNNQGVNFWLSLLWLVVYYLAIIYWSIYAIFYLVKLLPWTTYYLDIYRSKWVRGMTFLCFLSMFGVCVTNVIYCLIKMTKQSFAQYGPVSIAIFYVSDLKKNYLSFSKTVHNFLIIIHS